MRKSLLFLLNTLLAAATLCVVSCGIDDVDAEDGAIQFELYDTEGTLIEGLQSMKFGATTAYTLKSAFVTYTEVTAPAGWKCSVIPSSRSCTVTAPVASDLEAEAGGDITIAITSQAGRTMSYTLSVAALEESISLTFDGDATTKNHIFSYGKSLVFPFSCENTSSLKVEAPEGWTTETDLENYPGLYLTNAGAAKNGLKGVFAPCPEKLEQGGHNNLQMLVRERKDHIAEINAPRTFPWRVAIVGTDTDLAASDLSFLLAAPSKIDDTSWIKPGKVAWEWWNDWNISDVDFRAGINTETYKYYIDFAAEKGIEYVILDEGWAVNKQADLMQVVPEIDLPEIVNYGQQKGVGIILWAGYWAFDRDLENVCKHYSEMGVKGFKVDFMDRDDQQMTAFNYRAAATAARYGLILDLHGTHKPAGLNRTWPNVLNFEGVHGLEQMKWSPESVDQMKYDVTIPFIRQAAGPMDYTQGAMRNATRNNYRPVNSEPMSQGTRCHQLALYVVLDSPLNMLCDSPTAYLHEKECTEFIAAIPTVWDETRILGGRLGEYIVTARRKGSTWYVGGITDWTPRDVEIDLAPLGIDATVEATIFRDGANADRKASDYRRASIRIDTSKPLTVHLAPGGGFVVKIED